MIMLLMVDISTKKLNEILMRLLLDRTMSSDYIAKVEVKGYLLMIIIC